MHLASVRQRLIRVGLAALLCAAYGFSASPLIEAAKNLDRDALRSLIENGADVNAAEGDGATALVWACYLDDLESAEILIRAGADVNAANDLGVTALWAASQNGNAAIARSLLAAGAGPDNALLAGETPLMVAARAGFPDVVDLLLSNGANPNARAARDQTALMWAVAQVRPKVVKALLAHGADVRLRTEAWSQMMAVPPHGYPGYNRVIPHGSGTALHFAARSGDLASAKLLVAGGADVDDVDAWGVSAVVLAAQSGFGELVEFLLEQGADPNLAEAGFTALHIAIMRRDDKMARALVSHGADPNAPIQAWTPTRRSAKDLHFPPELVGATPFWLAARFSQPGVMRFLAEHGADPLSVHRSEYVTTDGLKWPRRIEETTALMAAIGVGGGSAWVPVPPEQRESLMLEAVKAAVELGVEVNAHDLSDKTALEIAEARKLQSVIAFLTANSARPSGGSPPNDEAGKK